MADEHKPEWITAKAGKCGDCGCSFSDLLAHFRFCGKRHARIGEGIKASYSRQQASALSAEALAFAAINKARRL